MAETVVTERHGAVVVIRIDRPEVRNALDEPTLEALVAAVERADGDETVGAVVITGGEEVFAAGADVRAMVDRSAVEVMAARQEQRWRRLRQVGVPLVAAVNGFALGGGCELALCCDLIVAGDQARFGQPEILLGIIPGAGGTQRLARTAGKHLAMDLCLTGRIMDAEEARRVGIVSRLVPPRLAVGSAVELAAEIAARPRLAARLAKRAVLAAFETPLEAGLELERQAFTLAMATEDRVEGMRAFLEKREPRFRGD